MAQETGEAPPVADQASLFRGKSPSANSGYEVSAVWFELTVYPSWVIYAPRAAFGGCAPKRACGRESAHTLYPQGYAASVKRRSR